MNSEMTKVAMRRFVAFINAADRVAERMASTIISESAVFHVPGRPKPLIGPGGYLEILSMLRAGFPDMEWTLEQMVVEDDWVAARFASRGTHLGRIFGLEPTGVNFKSKAMNFYRFDKEGKIAEEFALPDFLGLLQQLGAVPKNIMPELADAAGVERYDHK